MKFRRSRTVFIVSLFLIVFVYYACDEESQESEGTALNQEYQRIISFVKTRPCYSSSECRFTGIGSKPCGGPWKYVVYSMSLDTVRLFRMISDYNSHEREYNRKWGLVSDCSIPPPPDSVGCREGVCVGYRRGNVLDQ